MSVKPGVRQETLMNVDKVLETVVINVDMTNLGDVFTPSVVEFFSKMSKLKPIQKPEQPPQKK
jgi:hypothetical protein